LPCTPSRSGFAVRCLTRTDVMSAIMVFEITVFEIMVFEITVFEIVVQALERSIVSAVQ
jgi:hypothetical protein